MARVEIRCYKLVERGNGMEGGGMKREEAVAVLRELIEAIEDDQAYSQLTHGMYKDGYRRIDAYKTAIAALREPEWARTADRLPDGNEHDDVLGLYKGLDYLMYDLVQIGWLRLHPEMYVFWMRLPEKPEVEG